MNQQMPYSIDAEKSLLGSILLYPHSMKACVEDGLEDDDFYIEGHRVIFKLMSMLYSDSKNVDLTTVTTKLKDVEQLEKVGGFDYLIQLQDLAVTSANTKSYIEIVQNKRYMRDLITTCNVIVEDTYDGSINIDELLDSAEKNVLAVSHKRRVSDFKSAENVVEIVYKDIKNKSENHSNVTGVPTGYSALDNRTNGLQKGDLIILAARPSVGKTAFALNLALNIGMRSKDAVALFSLEMPAEQLISRMLAARAQVKMQNMRTGYLDNNEMNQISEAVLDLKESKIFIEDSSMVKIPEIFSKCRKLKAEHGLSLIVIDYIQLITSAGKSDNRQQEVSEMSRSLKNLARELECPVLALSQLSRAVEKREDKHPMLSDLRESGSLEQDADIVMFLYREDYYNRDNSENKPKREEVDVNLAKHRNGPTGSIKLAFEREINAFFGVSNLEE